MTRRAHPAGPAGVPHRRGSAVPSGLTRRLRLGVPALALAASLALAGCGGADDEAPQAGSSASDAGTSATSDGGSGASDGGGQQGAGASGGKDAPTEETTKKTPKKVAVTPPQQKVDLPEACTGEGAYLVQKGKRTDPKLPKRHGKTLDVRLKKVTSHDGADLVAKIGGEDRPIETAHVGDTIGLDGWTISLTSVCDGQIEFDLID